MKDDTPEQRCGCFSTENIVKTFSEMGIQIVHDKMDPSRFGIYGFDQMLNERYEIGLCSVVSNSDNPASTFWLDRYKQITVTW